MERAAIFKRLGLPKHADRLYDALDAHGAATIGQIAKRIRVHRPAVYRAADALEHVGLIIRKQYGARTYFSSAPQSVIASLFAHATHTVAESVEKKITDSFGAIRYLEGERAVTAVFVDVIEQSVRGDTFYRYTSERDLDTVNALLPTDYRKRRDAKKLERLVISNRESGLKKRSRLERFIKYLDGDRERFRQNAIQLIYGSRLAFIDLNTYRGFIIDNATLAEFQKTIFKALYRRL